MFGLGKKKEKEQSSIRRVDSSPTTFADPPKKVGTGGSFNLNTLRLEKLGNEESSSAPGSPRGDAKRKSLGGKFSNFFKSKAESSEDEVIKSAQFYKLGEKVKSWKKRQFTLTRESLRYHDKTKLKGSIPLLGAAITIATEKKDREFMFGITPKADKRTYYICATSQAEMVEWVELLKKLADPSLYSEVASSPVTTLVPPGGSPVPQSSPTGTQIHIRKEKQSSPSIDDLSKSVPSPVFAGVGDASSERSERESQDEGSEMISATPKTPCYLSEPRGSIMHAPGTVQHNASNSIFAEFIEEQPGVATEEQRHSLTIAKEERKGFISEDDEFDIAMCAAEIFLKDPKDRTPEEQAYVVAMRQYREQLIQHMKNNKACPEYSLASGTVIFMIPPGERTESEHEYVKEICSQYLDMIDKAPASDCEGGVHIPVEVENEILVAAKAIYSKPANQRTPAENEYISKIEKQARLLKILEYKHGVHAKHSLATSAFIFTKYKEERSLEDYLFLEEVGALAQTNS